jgi:predicted O-methyltransferase YrrM
MGIDFKNYAQSRMSPFDELALKLLLGKISLQQEEIFVLEIGSWLGAGSTQVFSEFAKKIVCVDHWQGNENQDHKDIVKEIDPYLIFQENISRFKDKVISIRCNSNEIGEIIKDQTFDFIFIDGDHRYAQTKSDLEVCLPKLKSKGIICGHDCEGRVNSNNIEFLKENIERDHIDSIYQNFKHCHPGVILAVDELVENFELFSDEKFRMELEVEGQRRFGNSSIWFKIFD